jgi:hypothetical protein
VTYLGRGSFSPCRRSLPTYNHDMMVTYSLLAVNRVASLIFDGVFEAVPDASVRAGPGATAGSCRSCGGWTRWSSAQGRVTHLPKPSGTSTTSGSRRGAQLPEDRGRPAGARVDGGRPSAAFSTDYPHWTFDDRSGSSGRSRAAARAIMLRTASSCSTSRTLPALEGQAQVW